MSDTPTTEAGTQFTPQQLQQVNQKIRQWRPASWEDDISIKTLDSAPFENAPKIAQLDQEKAKQIFDSVIDTTLRCGKSFEDYAARDPFPIPGDDDREGYLRGHHERFWVMGLQDYLRVNAVLQRHNVRPTTIFEMGSASGRALRHFATQGDFEQIWASDINYRHVRWVNENLEPKIRMIHNSTLPHLPMCDQELDLVCAFSVFSHIDVFETAWLAEVRRILKPGGIAYLTTHTEHSWEALKEFPESRMVDSIKKSGLYSEGMLERPMPGDRLIFRHTPHGPYRGCIYHSERYLRDVWGRFFNILEIIPMHHGVCQSVVVMQRQ